MENPWKEKGVLWKNFEILKKESQLISQFGEVQTYKKALFGFSLLTKKFFRENYEVKIGGKFLRWNFLRLKMEIPLNR